MVTMTLAVHARPGNITDVSIWKGKTVGDLIHTHPEVADQLVRIVFPEGYVVLRHTGDHASATARAFVEINYHAVLVSLPVSCLMFLFHGYPFLL